MKKGAHERVGGIFLSTLIFRTYIWDFRAKMKLQEINKYIFSHSPHIDTHNSSELGQEGPNYASLLY